MNTDEKPPPQRSGRFGGAVAALLSLLSGLAVALVLHYILYRFGLPSTPFIYVNF